MSAKRPRVTAPAAAPPAAAAATPAPSSGLVDLLIVVCNPTKNPKFTLPKAKEEADAVRKLAEKHGKRVEVRYSCTADELRKLFAKNPAVHRLHSRQRQCSTST